MGDGVRRFGAALLFGPLYLCVLSWSLLYALCYAFYAAAQVTHDLLTEGRDR